MTTIGDQERAHLAKADQHIADAECHITAQEARIACLRADGHDVGQFEDVLAAFRAMLEQHQAHRAVILQRLVALEERSGCYGHSPV